MHRGLGTPFGRLLKRIIDLAKSFFMTDAGFWIALLDKGDDGYHQSATDLWDIVKDEYILIPWPIFYEVLRTRLVKKPWLLTQFKFKLSEIEWTKIDDSKYRDSALENTIALIDKRELSLVDRVLRLIIDDISGEYKINYLITYNKKDFYDVCYPNSVEMIP